MSAGPFDPRRRAPVLLVRDLAAARTFWELLGLRCEEEGPGLARVAGEGRELCLWERGRAAGVLGLAPEGLGDCGCYFLAHRDPERVRTRLEAAGCPVHERRAGLRAGIELLVRDPDGHLVVVEPA